MKRFKNIVISGDVGTGTSTLTRNLSEKLGWESISAGKFFRQYAIDHNIDLWDKWQVSEEFEREVDEKLLDMAINKENIVIEGHYQAWRTRDLNFCFRVKTQCDPGVALNRTVKRIDETHVETTEDVLKRRAALDAAFKKLYGKHTYLDHKLFHLIVDTTTHSPDEVANQVLDAFNEANRN